MGIETIAVNGGNVQGLRFQSLPAGEGAHLGAGTAAVGAKVNISGIDVMVASWYHTGTRSWWAILQAESRYGAVSGSLAQLIMANGNPLSTVLDSVRDLVLGSTVRMSAQLPLLRVADDFNPGGNHPRALILPVSNGRRNRSGTFLQYSLSKSVGQSYQQNYLFTSICGHTSSQLQRVHELVRAVMSPFGL